MNTQNKQFKTFDPNPSIKYALSLLSEADIRKFALIGKLAMWVHIEDESQHQFTKDVDFAVFVVDTNKIEQLAIKKKLNFHYLQIGGVGLREQGINIDFIDRRLHGVNSLFNEAIENTSLQVFVDELSVPVVSLEYLVAMKIISGEPKDDNDLQILMSLEKLDYKKSRKIVVEHLGQITGERLDVFAREAGILPKRGPYIYGR